MDLPAVGRDRHAQVRHLIDEMESAKPIEDGQFNALGMLVTDASLAADEPALEAAQNGLQWLYSRTLTPAGTGDDHVDERRGRLLGMIDITHWALRRLPSTLQAGPSPASHARRFLEAVAERPGLSNQELAVRLDIDETEVSRVGRRLLAAGLVWRRKEWRRNAWDITPRGRKSLENAGLASADTDEPELEFAVGVKVLPDRLIGVIVDANARKLRTVPRELQPAAGPAVRVNELAAVVQELVSKAPGSGDSPPDRIGLGVEMSAHISARAGKVVFAPNYGPSGGWDDFPLHEELQRATTFPAVIENDANAIAEYEYVSSREKEPESLVAIVLDEGIGCGLMINGRPVHGVHSMAGEIGHIVVEPEGRKCRCGNHGCLESVASMLGITQNFDELAGGVAADTADLARVIRCFDNKDKHAAAAIDRAGDALGLAISTLLNLVNPEKLVLYGPAELVGESEHASARRFMKHVRQSAKKYAFSTADGDCSVIPKAYDYETGAQAVATVALLRARRLDRAGDEMTSAAPVNRATGRQRRPASR